METPAGIGAIVGGTVGGAALLAGLGYLSYLAAAAALRPKKRSDDEEEIAP